MHSIVYYLYSDSAFGNGQTRHKEIIYSGENKHCNLFQI